VPNLTRAPTNGAPSSACKRRLADEEIPDHEYNPNYHWRKKSEGTTKNSTRVSEILALIVDYNLYLICVKRIRISVFDLCK
jgi:hypothetical protein